MKTKRKDKRDTGQYQSAVRDFVQREVIYCVSMLIHELGKSPGHADDLMEAFCKPDYEEAAIQWPGTEWRPHFVVQKGLGLDKRYFYWRDKKSDDGFEGPFTTCEDAWQNICETYDIDTSEYTREVYEHWLVTDWMADKLEQHGEMVIRDFMGLTIWGRTCTGQAIYMDGVICRIYDELQRA